jgi:hypothetical protein
MVRTAKKPTGISGVPTTKKPTEKNSNPTEKNSNDDVSSVRVWFFERTC